MHFASPDALARSDARTWARGPVLVILCEDAVEVESTLAHHIALGFRTIVLALPPGLHAPVDLGAGVHTLAMGARDEAFATTAVNAAAAALPEGHWLGYLYNAEYLFFPFSESRSIGEALQFCAEERRASVLTYVIDLYAPDLTLNGVDLAAAHLDRTGYYALARYADGQPLERQMDIFGGLRWRYEEHVPWERRRIDRVGLFRTGPEVRLTGDHTTSEPERNTYACPWHHSMTATICSFRAAKALATNPGSRAQIESFLWHNSIPFEWRAQQLLDLGLMEPGQWF